LLDLFIQSKKEAASVSFKATMAYSAAVRQTRFTFTSQRNPTIFTFKSQIKKESS